NEWTLRLPALFASILIIASVYYLGREAGGHQIGLIAALLLLSSFYFVGNLRESSSDLYLTAFTAAALACWWRGYEGGAKCGGWWAVAGCWAGLGMATKGTSAGAML